jgi:hypothetical protein
MFFWLIFAFCALGGAYGVYAIARDNGRGYVRGRGFGFERATQPTAYYALMTFNCVVTILLLTGACVLAFIRLQHLIPH